jgi:hypothetical protein
MAGSRASRSGIGVEDLMRRSKSVHLATAALVGFGVTITGCEVEVRGGVAAPVAYAAVEVYPAPPPLVEIDTGVSVVSDSEYPVYYTGGGYWEYRGNAWYHAPAWDADWVAVQIDVVPVGIAHRNHSEYVHYHAAAGARAWREDDKHTSYQSHGSTGHDSGHNGSAATNNGAPSQQGQQGHDGGHQGSPPSQGTPPGQASPPGHDSAGHEATGREAVHVEEKPVDHGLAPSKVVAPTAAPDKVETRAAVRPTEAAKPGTPPPATSAPPKKKVEEPPKEEPRETR